MITITIKRPLISTKFTMNLFFMQIKRFISFTWHILSTFMDNRLLFFSIFFQLFCLFSTFLFFFPRIFCCFLFKFFYDFEIKICFFIVLTQYYSIFMTINLDSYCHFSRKDDFLPFLIRWLSKLYSFFIESLLCSSFKLFLCAGFFPQIILKSHTHNWWHACIAEESLICLQVNCWKFNHWTNYLVLFR